MLQNDEIIVHKLKIRLNCNLGKTQLLLMLELRL